MRTAAVACWCCTWASNTLQSQVGLLGLANRSVLTNPLVPGGRLRHASDVSFPSVEEGYVTPRFRSAVNGAQARPSEEAWWDAQPVRGDLDEFLVAHFSSPDSTLTPLLLLGHPGAGKSLLTRVLAARLPAEGYTVVWVPLRVVDADAPVHEQIQQALDVTTHGRVTWRELTEESAGSVRVVLLDGFDEMLLASARTTKAGYLQEVVDFQQRESDLERPVAVVVTSRTIVIDRARIPAACPMIQLAEFDDAAVGAWLRAWNEANRAGIYAGSLREVRPQDVRRHEDLARQPLLLLMLALYMSDARTADLDATVLSATDLYQRLLENFVRREVARGRDDLSDPEVERAVVTTMWHLGIAAFAMFNRGRQYVSEQELAADFAALLEGGAGPGDLHRNADLAERTVGRFFFVQTAEFNTRIGINANRCYEFLHATFAEFLIAMHIVELLAELAHDRGAARRASPDVDASVLRALLSYQALAARRPIVTFAADLFAALPPGDRAAVLDLLAHLSTRARELPTGPRVPYRPLADDVPRAVAAYTANLILLRVALPARRTRLAIAELAPGHADAAAWWRSTVRIWWAGLSEQEWTAMESLVEGGGYTWVGARDASAGVDATAHSIARELESR